LTGGQLDTARNNFFPTPLLTYKDLGMTAAVQPNEQIAGKDTHVILLTPKSGPAQRMFFDATSFMLVRTTSTIDAAELGTVQQVSDMSDFRTVDNMKVAFSMTQLVGDQSIVLKFTKIEHNVAIDDSVFVKK
jgi:outer membrane lipoprotein-sorting protein